MTESQSRKRLIAGALLVAVLLAVVWVVRSGGDSGEGWADAAEGYRGPSPTMIGEGRGHRPEAPLGLSNQPAGRSDSATAPTPAPTPVPEYFPSTDDAATSEPIELALTLGPGTLKGWVSDMQGLPVEGALVSLAFEQELKGGVSAPKPTAITSALGRFRFRDIPPGRWSVTAEKAGFGKTSLAGQEVESGDVHRVTQLVLGQEQKVAGKVLAEGNPIAGARVTALREHVVVASGGVVESVRIAYQSVESTESGEFELAGLPPGMLVLVVEADGFATAEQHLDVGASTAPVEVHLEPEALLAGIVKTWQGVTLMGAEVKLHSAAQPDAKNLLADVMTGKDGRFNFPKLPAGRTYWLVASHAAFAPSTPTEVQTGTASNIVYLDSGGVIEGAVTSVDTGSPIPGMTVLARNAASSFAPLFSTSTNSNGRYRFERLPGGNYTVGIRNERLTSEAKSGVAVARSKPVQGVDFAVYPGLTIRGTVVDGETGERLSGAKITLGSRIGPQLDASGSQTASTDQFGLFQFVNLPQGIYTVAANKDGYLKGVESESSRRLEIQRSIDPEPVELVLFPGGIIEGQVVDGGGNPAAGALVQLFHAPGSPGRIKVNDFKTTADGAGSFRIDGIPLANEVLLRASAWAPGQSKGASEDILLNRRTTWQSTVVVLGGGSDLAVRVLDEQGSPLADASVSISHAAFPGDPSPPAWSVKTDAGGGHVFARVPEGRVSVGASLAGYMGGSATVTLTGSGLEHVSITLKKGRTLAGRVTDDRALAMEAGAVNARPEAGATGSGSGGISGGRFHIGTLGEGTFEVEVDARRTTATGARRVIWSFPGITPNEGSAEPTFRVPFSGVIVGTVASGDTDQALAAFSVELTGKYIDGASRERTFRASHRFSNAASFRFEALPPGEYSARVTAPDHLPAEVTELILPSPGEVSAGHVRLDPGGSLKIRVLDALTTEPVNGARVSLQPSGPGGGTNAKGEARLSPVAPGIYTIAVTHGDYVAGEKRLFQVTRKDLTDAGDLELEPAGVLSGEVIDGGARPVVGALIEVWPAEGPVMRARTDAGGRYKLRGIPPGGLVAACSAKINDREVSASVEETVSPGGETTRDFVLRADSTLTGRLLAAADIDLSRARVHVYPLRADRVPMLAAKVEATIPALGEFRVINLTEGRWLVTVEAPGADRTSYWTGLAEIIARENRTVVQGGRIGLSGVVRHGADGPPVPNQQVRLGLLSAPQSGVSALRKWWQWSTSTDEAGQYSFGELPAGTFEITARNDELGADYLNVVDLGQDGSAVVHDLELEGY